MNWSPAFKWSIVLLLPLTLAWKLAVTAVQPSDPNELTSRLAEFLVQLQFEVAETQQIIFESPTIRAAKDGCRMVVIGVSPLGWTKHLVADLAGETQRAFFVFQGRVYAEQPTWLTLITHFKSRFLRDLGMARPATSVIAVVASAICDAENLPWEQLRERGVL